MTCTFFGHKDTPSEVRAALMSVLRQLITEEGVESFLVGNQGGFDHYVLSALRELEKEVPTNDYHVVLAYMPGKKQEYDTVDYRRTIYPEGIENVPRRFAISWRNKWMLQRSDIVVTYITHSWGGAAQFAEQAVRQKKQVINLASALKEKT